MAVPVPVPYGTVPAVIAWGRQTRRRVHRRLLLGYNRVEADVSRLDCLVSKLCLINSCVGVGGHHFESGCDANSNTHVRYVLRTVRYVRKCVVAGTIALWQDSARLAQLIEWSASSSYPAQWPPTCHLARFGTQHRPIVALFPSSLSYACRLLTQISLNHYRYGTVVFLARKLLRSKPTMAEIGLVASIIAVLQISAKVTSLLSEYGTAIKHASGDLRRIESEVNNISSLLRKVENMAKRLKERGCSSEQWSSLSSLEGGPIDSVRSALRTLEEQLRPVNSLNEFIKLRERLRWPGKLKKIEKALGAAREQKKFFEAALGIDAVWVSLQAIICCSS